jgi:hypothetical protein
MNARNRTRSAALLMALFLSEALALASSILETGVRPPPPRIDLATGSAAGEARDEVVLRAASHAPGAEIGFAATATNPPPVMLDLAAWDRGFKALPDISSSSAGPDLLWKTCYLLPASDITSTGAVRQQLLRLVIAVEHETGVQDWSRILIPTGDPTGSDSTPAGE